MNHNDKFGQELIILQLLDEHRLRGLTAPEIAEELDTPIASIYRILRILKAYHWVYNPKKKYGSRKEARKYKPRFRIVMVGEE
jgi:DNA-binding IclR family transcriptional regulator